MFGSVGERERKEMHFLVHYYSVLIWRGGKITAKKATIYFLSI
jgi:hypothetical protein